LHGCGESIDAASLSKPLQNSICPPHGAKQSPLTPAKTKPIGKRTLTGCTVKVIETVISLLWLGSTWSMFARLVA
jgi:hypothetical protein